MKVPSAPGRAFRDNILRLEINLLGKPLTHHEVMNKLASEEMTVCCVPAASINTFGQQTGMSHPTSPCGMGLQIGAGISVIKTTLLVLISHSAALLNKVFMSLRRKAGHVEDSLVMASTVALITMLTTHGGHTRLDLRSLMEEEQ